MSRTTTANTPSPTNSAFNRPLTVLELIMWVLGIGIVLGLGFITAFLYMRPELDSLERQLYAASHVAKHHLMEKVKTGACIQPGDEIPVSRIHVVAMHFKGDGQAYLNYKASHPCPAP